jgi:pimeloyl-ACP methyl ester carboxylesterase
VQTANRHSEPLLIARQGSLEAGGRTVYCQINDGVEPDNWRFGPGQVVIDHVHAHYQYPVDQRYEYPILFNPGGGHSARCYDTTPDGREGWLTLFLRRGFATYGVDRVNLGRSGSDIGAINAAKIGAGPASAMPALNRYSAESAWKTFRWGPEYGVPYPNTRFPIAYAEQYYKQMLTTYRDREETAKNVAAWSALLDQIGPAVLQTWSSSGLLGYLTAIERPELVKGILAVETSVSAFGNIPTTRLNALAQVPIYIVIGDRAEDRVAAARDFQETMRAFRGGVTVDVLPEHGIYGNGHTLAFETNNIQIMERMIAWLDEHVYHRIPQPAA